MVNKVVVLSLLLLIVLVGIGFVLTSQQNQTTDFKPSDPEQVVRQYFESWDKKDWPNMYSVISDGFKKIEPTAKTLSDFKQYVESQNISGINILSIKEQTNDGKAATVDYSVGGLLSDGTTSFNGSFTLKYREADIIRGWKLIHPYGSNIDTS